MGTASRDHFVEVNFEERPNLTEIFEKDLNVARIGEELSIFSGRDLTNPATILFMDEIQIAPKAITSLRYFYGISL